MQIVSKVTFNFSDIKLVSKGHSGAYIVKGVNEESIILDVNSRTLTDENFFQSARLKDQEYNALVQLLESHMDKHIEDPINSNEASAPREDNPTIQAGRRRRKTRKIRKARK